ncbi:Bacillopeptidase F [Pseudolycoriella hygida]|uniref:Bacillopeptidase F n=1 Tax=Pseudolycoriella hygida TaxID=35572 RepID=A0A9Q0NG57_9DIPT|nr:Bacillopeptidase F [Pseudolycoriella hygida]
MYRTAFVVFALVCSVLAIPQAKVDENIWEKLEQTNNVNVLVTFKKANTKAAYDRFHSLRLTSREATLNAHYSILKDHADVVQADVTAMLRKIAPGKKHYLDVLWISNELIVRDADKEVIDMLRNHPDVDSLIAEKIIPLETVTHGNFSVLDENNIMNQWGVVNVRAPTVWENGNRGENVVIGIIDTGARVTHVALSDTYRGNPGSNHNYNWFAPAGQLPIPTDTHGHGTHVTGSAAATHGLGVAPGARWIACRGCAGAGCADLDLLSCGNWMACPTTTDNQSPNCSLAPRIVNNSWGGGQNNPWYNGIITAWRNVGIVPVFSVGNSGAIFCASVTSPGDQPGVVGVSSISENNQISDFTSIGPGPNVSQKPDVAAPGQDIISASHLYDDELHGLSGSSMAAPHVAGVAALILSNRPYLSVDEVVNALKTGAAPHTPLGRVCFERSDNQRPNFHVGYGRVDAVNSAR